MINTKRMYFVNLLMEKLPNAGMQKWKAKLYRWAGVKVGQDVEFFQGVKVQGTGELEIGDKAFIGHEVLFMLNEGSKVIVEPQAIVGSRSIVITGFHPIEPDGERILSREGTTSVVRIGRGCSVSTNCTVLPGISVGEMSLVAAGAVVAKDVAPYTVVGGCPAKFIKNLK